MNVNAHPDINADVFDIEGLADNPNYQSIKRLIGIEKAVQLSMKLGGQRVYIPAKPKEDSLLSQAIGLAPARRVSTVYGRLYMDVPLSAGKKERIIQLSKHGHSTRKIANEIQCSDRYVRMVKAAYFTT